MKKDLIETVECALGGEEKIEVLTFDFQRVLELPCIETDEVYRRRALWCNNFCVYDELRNIAYMYVWNETVASRGTQEIGSCLYKHFFEFISKDTRKVIFWSKPSVQSRNVKLALMLQKIFDYWKNPELKIIEQRFFLLGHTRSSCNRSFDLIEKQKRATEKIIEPSDWFDVIKEAKKTEPKFIVTEMRTKDFYSTQPLENLMFDTKKSVDGKTIHWSKFQTIIYDRNDPLLLRAQYYCIENPTIKTFSLLLKEVAQTFSATKLKYLYYPDAREISKKKYDDLQHSLEYMDEKCHSFYKSIKYSDASDKDFALADQQSSEDEESVSVCENDELRVENSQQNQPQ